MRRIIYSLLVIVTSLSAAYFSGCNRSQHAISQTPPPAISDSSLLITGTTKTDINEFDINWQVNPINSQSFSNVYLFWSTTQNFRVGSDSILISPSAAHPANGTKHLAGLMQNTVYYCKLRSVYNGQPFESLTKSFKTDSLIIISAFGMDTTFPLYVNRNFDQNSFLFTNFALSSPIINPDTSQVRISFGTHACLVANDQGNIILFHVPETIPPDSLYSLILYRKGMTTTIPNSIYVLGGTWHSATPPDIPVCNGCGYGSNGIGFFGTCQSATTGYMLGGVYEHPLGLVDTVARPDNGGPFIIRAFEVATGQWSQILPANPRMYNDPIAYYYNNSIYVLGGKLNYPQDGAYFVNTIWRLDLGSNIWTPIGTMPYHGIYNQASFELNGEWYIGMGRDSSNNVNGSIQFSKAFWKYTPSSNSWTRLADFPGAGNEDYPTCFTIGNQAYAFYGALIDGQANYLTDYKQELWNYDAATDRWSQIPLPASGGPPPGEKYSIVSYNGKAYFLSAQVRLFIGYYYGFQVEYPCLKWDPASNTFSRVSNAIVSGVLKPLYNSGDKFYFQSDAFGYIESMPDSTIYFVPDK